MQPTRTEVTDKFFEFIKGREPEEVIRGLLRWMSVSEILQFTSDYWGEDLFPDEDED